MLHSCVYLRFSTDFSVHLTQFFPFSIFKSLLSLQHNPLLSPFSSLNISIITFLYIELLLLPILTSAVTAVTTEEMTTTTLQNWEEAEVFGLSETPCRVFQNNPNRYDDMKLMLWPSKSLLAWVLKKALLYICLFHLCFPIAEICIWILRLILNNSVLTLVLPLSCCQQQMTVWSLAKCWGQPYAYKQGALLRWNTLLQLSFRNVKTFQVCPLICVFL